MANRKDSIEQEVTGILHQPWSTRTGIAVPSTDSVALNGGRVDMYATMLYADLADSTVIAMANREASARLFRAYLALCARLIVGRGGEIRSFDGDRIMAVFVGGDSNFRAVSAGMEISWTFANVLVPLFQSHYPMFVTGGYRLGQAVGIDCGEVSVVRGGIRAHNDLVWIGRAPNVAAKLSNIREGQYSVFVSEEVFQTLPPQLLYAPNTPQVIWDILRPAGVPLPHVICTRWWLPLI